MFEPRRLCILLQRPVLTKTNGLACPSLPIPAERKDWNLSPPSFPCSPGLRQSLWGPAGPMQADRLLRNPGSSPARGFGKLRGGQKAGQGISDPWLAGERATGCYFQGESSLTGISELNGSVPESLSVSTQAGVIPVGISSRRASPRRPLSAQVVSVREGWGQFSSQRLGQASLGVKATETGKKGPFMQLPEFAWKECD